MVITDISKLCTVFGFLFSGDKEDFQLETMITLNDVKGLEETKAELEEIVHYLRDREVSLFVNPV